MGKEGKTVEKDGVVKLKSKLCRKHVQHVLSWFCVSSGCISLAKLCWKLQTHSFIVDETNACNMQLSKHVGIGFSIVILAASLTPGNLYQYVWLFVRGLASSSGFCNCKVALGSPSALVNPGVWGVSCFPEALSTHQSQNQSHAAWCFVPGAWAISCLPLVFLVFLFFRISIIPFGGG